MESDVSRVCWSCLDATLFLTGVEFVRWSAKIVVKDTSFMQCFEGVVICAFIAAAFIWEILICIGVDISATLFGFWGVEKDIESGFEGKVLLSINDSAEFRSLNLVIMLASLTRVSNSRVHYSDFSAKVNTILDKYNAIMKKTKELTFWD